MIGYVLFCILWSKPEIQLVEVPINEYATADVNQDFGAFHFEGNVFEGRMNSVKIVHIPTQFSTEAFSANDHQQRSLYVKLEMDQFAASLSCELRPPSGPGKK